MGSKGREGWGSSRFLEARKMEAGEAGEKGQGCAVCRPGWLRPGGYSPGGGVPAVGTEPI